MISFNKGEINKVLQPSCIPIQNSQEQQQQLQPGGEIPATSIVPATQTTMLEEAKSPSTTATTITTDATSISDITSTTLATPLPSIATTIDRLKQHESELPLNQSLNFPEESDENNLSTARSVNSNSSLSTFFNMCSCLFHSLYTTKKL